MKMTVKNTIKQAISQVLAKKYKLGNFELEINYPPVAEMGDYATSAAMALAKILKRKPLEVAEEIAGELKGMKEFKEIKVAAPGFINFFVAEEFLQENLKEIWKEKEKYGQLKPDKKLKIQVEFISANPTGPLTLANGRGGFSGDVLANVLSLAGNKVEREYYVNDIGNQVEKLGHSILKDEETVYTGEYIDELVKKIKEKDPKKAGLIAAEFILKNYIQPVVKKVGIEFDNYFSERKLHESGAVEKMLEVLKKKNLVYEKDGAWWLKTSEQNEGDDDKDRVLVKSDSSKTYFLADIAYHWNKFHDRKFDKVINLWGADHHGYVARMKSAMAMLGFPGQLEILLMQMVRLIENGQEKRMSKRQGVYVLLEDLIDEVGLDVARFFFLMHANNKGMDFDLNLAKERSNNNPVFYVQYAHARICSILEKTKGLKQKAGDKNYKLHRAEKELIKELIKWPELIFEVAQNYEVHKIPFYTIALADKFHDFYENCRVIEDEEVNKFRLDLIKATKQVLKNSLSCLGVTAPEKM
ncbi:MAG: arginine--tRNA ligase [Patescibacteria group bacterium]|nr:arginine--tRNA ligase [Patescibacteria group bacterium]